MSEFTRIPAPADTLRTVFRRNSFIGAAALGILLATGACSSQYTVETASDASLSTCSTDTSLKYAPDKVYGNPLVNSSEAVSKAQQDINVLYPRIHNLGREYVNSATDSKQKAGVYIEYNLKQPPLVLEFSASHASLAFGSFPKVLIDTDGKSPAKLTPQSVTCLQGNDLYANGTVQLLNDLVAETTALDKLPPR